MPHFPPSGSTGSNFRSRSARRLAGLAAVVAVPLAAVAETSPIVQIPYALEARCYDCHMDGGDKGGFKLDDLIAKGAGVEHRGEWLKVWRNVRNEFMPPAGEDHVPAEERREIARWIEETIFAVDPTHVDPGLVTIRRLNREEYQHTVNDLLGTDFDLKERLLPDDSAHGFDNIGDAQTLSPALFDRYLDLADWVVSEVVVDDGAPLPTLLKTDLTKEPLAANAADTLEQLDNGGFLREMAFEVPKDGRFRVDLAVRLGGWQDHTGDAQLKILVDEHQLEDRTLPIAGSLNEVYSYEFEATAGLHRMVVRADLIPPPAEEELLEALPPPAPALRANNNANGEVPSAVDEERRRRFAERRAQQQKLLLENFPEEANQPRGRGPAGPPAPPKLEFRDLELVVTGPLDGSIDGEYPAAHRRIFFAGAAPEERAARSAYAREILNRFASRAFRRPVDRKTLDNLVAMVEAEDVFETGVGTAMTAVMVSPRFLYREELQPEPDNPSESHELDDYALASRLSHLLWLSIPDEELTAEAAAGTLRHNLDAQVKRMLADPKSDRFFLDFTGQWLRTRNILMAVVTPGNISDRLDPLRESMKAETDMLFEYIAREDRDLLEVITADYSFLNEDLARWYRVEGVEGDEMRKVDLPPETNRGGVLTHASILVSTSNPNRTSPVKRGVFVLENIFGTPPPPPPAAVPTLEEAAKEGIELLTLRDQLAVHREDKACAACHAHFDPIGLALENFSYIGRWRETDNGVAIDTSGEMATGETFGSFAELRNLIAERKDKYYRGVTEKLMTYALGRGLEPYDAATIDEITDSLLNGGGKFSQLLMGVVESPAFQERRGAGERVNAAPSSYAVQ